jgi:hypothetical protein
MRKQPAPVHTLINETLRKARDQLALALAAAARRDTPLAERIADEITAIEDLTAFVAERLETLPRREAARPPKVWR